LKLKQSTRRLRFHLRRHLQRRPTLFFIVYIYRYKKIIIIFYDAIVFFLPS
jgi:hypothetical protein